MHSFSLGRRCTARRVSATESGADEGLRSRYYYSKPSPSPALRASSPLGRGNTSRWRTIAVKPLKGRDHSWPFCVRADREASQEQRLTCFKQSRRFTCENWTLLRDDLPDDIIVQAIVAVCNDVAERDDATVVAYLSHECCIQCLKAAECLSNNFKLPLNCGTHHKVGRICCPGFAAGKQFNCRRGRQNIS